MTFNSKFPDFLNSFIIKGQIEIELEESEKLIEIPVPTLVKESEIYKSFFTGGCEHPKMMLEQILLHQSHYVPIFFFINEARMSVVEAIKFIENIESDGALKKTKNNLLIRINDPTPFIQGALLTDIRHRVIDSETFDDSVTKLMLRSTCSYLLERVFVWTAKACFQ